MIRKLCSLSFWILKNCSYPNEITNIANISKRNNVKSAFIKLMKQKQIKLRHEKKAKN